MDLESYLSLGLSTAQDAWSWLFLISAAAKVASTLLLLALKRWPLRWVERNEGWLWWVTKLSALCAAASAALLCNGAGDTQGETLFLALLVVATVLVAERVKTRRASQSRMS